MKNQVKWVLVIVFSTIFSGCSSGKWSPDDWESVAPIIEITTDYTTRHLLQTVEFKPYSEQICSAINNVSNVLNKIDDPDLTFDKIRESAINAVKEKLPQGPARDAALFIVDNVLSRVYISVKNRYEEFLEQDQNRIMLIISMAVSSGMNKACQSGLN